MRIRLFLAVLWTVLILVMCWIPNDWLPVKESGSEGFKIEHLDKLVHGSSFTGFAILWLLALPGKRRYVWVGLAGLALASLTEMGQTLPIIGRNGELADGLADVTGVLFGLLLSHWFDPVREGRPTSPISPRPVTTRGIAEARVPERKTSREQR